MQTLVPFHTFSLNSSANALIEVVSSSELVSTLANLKSSPYIILGEGSNTVFLEDYQGTVLKISSKGITFEQSENDFYVTAQAGENWHQLVLWCLQKQIYGLENLALIPGTVGAAPIQNIGAYGVELERFIHQVEYFDLPTGQLKNLSRQACQFAYRESIFKNQLLHSAVITQVTLKLAKDWQSVAHYGELKTLVQPTAKDIFDKVVEVRKNKLPDPQKLGNAGSFFKNPIISTGLFAKLQQNWPAIPSYPVDTSQVKVPAAWLIDSLGFKGKKVGGITCHHSQPLVLTNDGSGTGQELLLLAREIRTKVQQVFSITLENEVRLIDKNGAILL
ncbi:UDP-N-acetylmuramate dehydrogenase [Paraglaciecola sp. L3A3]|uniref:UDP-N-acetylmuramate dehydrogenase n=1 Tax=Paraglaciecola sp. L3A3 TaxID=2686358 RepID=UPI00131C5CA4|nr:UDP-N-acetylmuramate dehydrogenase [Paraglaciecola sp. L3A3]